MKDPIGELREIVIEGLADSILQAEEAITLRAKIGTTSTRTGESGLDHLFDRLQVIMERFAILSTCSLFEKESDNYPLQSLPTALNHLRFNAEYLKIENKEFVIKKLISFGHEENQFEGIPDPWITQLVRKEFADRLPVPGNSGSGELSKAMDTLKSLHDTPVSHLETTQEPDGLTPVEAGIRTLLEFARDFVETIGKGYLNIDSEWDTARTSGELIRLLNQAGIQA